MPIKRAYGHQRIVYVHNAPIPSAAANSVQVAKMCDAFRRAGVPTILALPRGLAGTAQEIQDQYGLLALPEVWTSAVLPLIGREIAFGIAVWLKYGKDRHTYFYTRSVSLAYTLARGNRNVVLELHGPSSQMRPVLQRRLSALVASNHLKHVVVISTALARHFLQSFPILEGKLLVARDGADVLKGPITAMTLSGAFKVGYIGQLYPGKGMELISAIAPMCPNITFHVVGGTAETLDHWRRALHDQRNIVLHGYVPHAETTPYLLAMDVMIAPYARVVHGVGGDDMNLAEWMSPLKLFEYMGARKPIVTSDLPVIREFLSDGRNALLCDPDNVSAWVDSLELYRSSPNLRSELGRHAHEDFLEQYTWDQRAKLILHRLFS